MPIQKDRLIERLAALGHIGSTPEGAVTRLAYTPGYRQAEEMVRTWMEEAGLKTRIDAVGNLIGRCEGKMSDAPCVMLGSHIDSVVSGGKYDGVLGVLSGVEVAQALFEDGVELDVPLEVVAFMDEEGTRWESGLWGSQAIAGQLTNAALQRHDRMGVTIAEAMKEWGLDPAQFAAATRSPSEIDSYLELHIEQGAVLENKGLAVGVVSAIAGALLLSARLSGRADHAGATPMGSLRHDAMLGAAEMALAAEAAAMAASPTCVATVGQLELKPGVFNIIPGEAWMTFDIRDIAETTRDKAEAGIRESIVDIARKHGLNVTLEESLRTTPVPLSSMVVEAISDACVELGLPVFRLPSGAGHDAQVMTQLADVGMIFVRCREGISHSPAEYVTPQDAFLGAQVLHEAVVQLGQARDIRRHND